MPCNTPFHRYLHNWNTTTIIIQPCEDRCGYCPNKKFKTATQLCNHVWWAHKRRAIVFGPIPDRQEEMQEPTRFDTMARATTPLASRTPATIRWYPNANGEVDMDPTSRDSDAPEYLGYGLPTEDVSIPEQSLSVLEMGTQEKTARESAATANAGHKDGKSSLHVHVEAFAPIIPQQQERRQPTHEGIEFLPRVTKNMQLFHGHCYHTDTGSQPQNMESIGDSGSIQQHHWTQPSMPLHFHGPNTYPYNPYNPYDPTLSSAQYQPPPPQPQLLHPQNIASQHAQNLNDIVNFPFRYVDLNAAAGQVLQLTRDQDPSETDSEAQKQFRLGLRNLLTSTVTERVKKGELDVEGVWAIVQAEVFVWEMRVKGRL